MEGFSSFRLNTHLNTKKAIILIHGFSGTPLELSSLAVKLTGTDAVVSVVRLPGHATHAEDLNNYNAEDWLHAIGLEIEYLVEKGLTELILIGHSMGSNIAFFCASKYPNYVKAIVSMNAPLKYAKYLHAAAKFMGYLGKTRLRTHVEEQFTDKSITETSFFKDLIDNYHDIPYYSLGQAIKLINGTENYLKDVHAKTLLIHSQNDQRAHWSESHKIYQLLDCEKEFLLLDDAGGHMLTVDHKFWEIEEIIFQYVEKCLQVCNI